MRPRLRPRRGPRLGAKCADGRARQIAAPIPLGSLRRLILGHASVTEMRASGTKLSFRGISGVSLSVCEECGWSMQWASAERGCPHGIPADVSEDVRARGGDLPS
jgi:hypothetical protein